MGRGTGAGTLFNGQALRLQPTIFHGTISELRKGEKCEGFQWDLAGKGSAVSLSVHDLIKWRAFEVHAVLMVS